MSEPSDHGKMQGNAILAAASPEDRLLLATLCIDPTETERRTIADLANEVTDWSYVIESSIRHATLPLLHRNLFIICPNALPPAERERLKTLAYTNVARNTFLTQKMFEVMNLLQEKDIRLCPFKGPVLAAALYGDLTLRRFDDIDFLVHRDDIFRARKILLSKGFHPNLDLTDAEARAHLRAGWDIIFKSPDEAYSIELDTGVAPRFFSFTIGPERLLQTFESVDVDGKDVRTLSAENLLLMLCAHGTKHLWSRLIWIADVKQLLHERSDLDWEQVFDRARVRGGQRMVLLGLQVAHDVLGATIPEAVAKHTTFDPLVANLSSQIIHRLFGHYDHPHPHLDRILFHLIARERIRDRARYVWLLLVTPTYSDWKVVRLPEALFWLYYVIRPLRCIVKGIRRLGKKKTRSPGNGPDHNGTNLTPFEEA